MNKETISFAAVWNRPKYKVNFQVKNNVQRFAKINSKRRKRILAGRKYLGTPLKTIPFYSLFKNLAQDFPVFLRCLGACILGYILINCVAYGLYDSPWDDAICQRPIIKYGAYTPAILYFLNAFIWVFQIPYEIFKYLNISARFFLETVLFAPTMEECTFRAPLIFLSKLTRREWFLAALLLNIVFAFGHTGKPIIWILNTFFLGGISCYAVYKTKRLWTSIMLHASFNGLLLSQKLAE